jgi:cytochrome c oxidase subunit 2
VVSFGQAHAAWTVNMAPGATEVSHAVFDLHMTIFWICVVIGIVVFGAMFWSMIVHRRSTGQVAANSTKAPPWKSSGPSCPC